MTTTIINTTDRIQFSKHPEAAVATALRDVAYVLQLTRKIKAEMMANKPATSISRVASDEVLTVVSA